MSKIYLNPHVNLTDMFIFASLCYCDHALLHA